MSGARAIVWEHWGNRWHRAAGPMPADQARALAAYIRDPVSDDDDDAHDSKVFEFDLVGAVADMDRTSFAALRPKTWTTIRAGRVYVTRRLGPTVIEVYDDGDCAYHTVVAP